jgi:hypothetical protein
MRFRSSQSPSPLDRQVQRRMLGYVAVIAVVLVAFQLLPQGKPAAPPPGPQPDPAAFRVRDEPAERPLAPDEFRLPPAREEFPDPAETVAAPPPTGEADPQLDKSRLAAVRDNTIGVRADEADAFFYVLDHVRRVPARFLDQSATPGVQHVNLMTDPGLHRGEPVTLIGEMRQLDEFPANDNRYGLQTLYVAWIFTSDSGTNPFRVVATSLGEGVQPGGRLSTPVRVTGYFFKREGYPTAGGLHVAPTLLARRINRYWPPNAPPPADGLAPIMLGLVVAIGLILSVTLLSFAWHDRRNPRRSTPLPSLSADHVRRLEELDDRSIADQLRALADRERAAEDGWPAPPPALRNGQSVDEHEVVNLPTPLPPTRALRPDSAGDEPPRRSPS